MMNYREAMKYMLIVIFYNIFIFNLSNDKLEKNMKHYGECMNKLSYSIFCSIIGFKLKNLGYNVGI